MQTPLGLWASAAGPVGTSLWYLPNTRVRHNSAFELHAGGVMAFCQQLGRSEMEHLLQMDQSHPPLEDRFSASFQEYGYFYNKHMGEVEHAAAMATSVASP